MTRIYSNEKNRNSERENDINSINSILSPSGPQASPANYSSPKELLHENSNTSPPMFATMTPVNAVDLQKDISDQQQSMLNSDHDIKQADDDDDDDDDDDNVQYNQEGRCNQMHVKIDDLEQNLGVGIGVGIGDGIGIGVSVGGSCGVGGRHGNGDSRHNKDVVGERVCDQDQQHTINEMYLNRVKTESDILYDNTEKEASNNMYTLPTATSLNQNLNRKNSSTPIDLIYEDNDNDNDNNKTVIYTTISSPKNLQDIYSTSNHENSINMNSSIITGTCAQSSDVNSNLNPPQNHLNEVLNESSLSSPVVPSTKSKNFLRRNISETSNIVRVAAAAAVTDSPNDNGAVSLMLQGTHPSLLQYPSPQSHQVPATTVLVLSELVDDISAVPVINVRKRKVSLNSDKQTVIEGAIGPIAGSTNQRMATELCSDPNAATIGIGINSHSNDVHEQFQQQAWRAIYEHPLTAATTAMLNISGAAPDDQSTAMGFIYEYCKLPTLASDATKDNCNKLQDIWQTGSQSTSILGAHLKNSSNVINGSSLDFGNVNTNQLNHSDLQGLFINPHIGYAQTVATSTAVQNQNYNNFNLQVIKREPEDLSHHRKLDVSSPILENNSSGIVISNKQQHHKVVLLPSSDDNQTNEHLVDIVSKQQQQHVNVVIKEEIHPDLTISPPNTKTIISSQNTSKQQDQTNIVKSMELNTISTSTLTSTSVSSLTSVSPATSTPNTTATAKSSEDNIKASMYASQIFSAISNHQNTNSNCRTPSPIAYNNEQYSQTNYGTLTASLRQNNSTTFTLTDPYYREYFTSVTTGTNNNTNTNTNTNTSSNSSSNAAHNPDSLVEPMYGSQTRQNQSSIYDSAGEMSGNPSGNSTPSFVDRYVRQSSLYHNKGVIAAATAAGLTVDLPSPDSGIGTDAITPRDQNTIQQSFDYAELCQNNSSLLEHTNLSTNSTQSQRSNSNAQNSSPSSSRSRPWHDFGRQSDSDKIQIPKLYSPYGFKYQLESPISTSQRIEEDRITYINKGQFYGILMDYVSDPDKQLKNQTVKSIIMLMFREEKSPEDEIKAWQFWHGRQHSVKQRILDADTKNSIGIVGCIEEIAHNAIAVYWNPLESGAKISVAIQCLSTDFSSQKGVKGLPLHLQIDTYEDPRDPVVSHRGYCQIKVFCDKGAERKTRDEERRAARRKSIVPKCKKIDEYHLSCEKSDFYSMSDLAKPPVLFAPAEDFEKLTSMDLQGFYSNDNENDNENTINSDGSSLKTNSGSPFLFNSMLLKGSTTTHTFKFHNHFPHDNDNTSSIDSKDHILNNLNTIYSPALKKPKFIGSSNSSSSSNSNCSNHSSNNIPPLSERVMLYVRQESDDAYTPIHVVPPTTVGLINAIEKKFKISASSINSLYRKNLKGISAKIDDDMLSYYCNEDLFLIQIKPSLTNKDLYDITFLEDHNIM